MTTKARAKGRIIEEVLETARDFHASGLIDKRRMKEYEALQLPPVPTMK